jgi:hypothetical protein
MRLRLSRQVAWRFILVCACIGAAVSIIAGKWGIVMTMQLIFLIPAVIVLHPVMNQTCNIYDSAILRSWRLYAGMLLVVISSLIALKLG